MNARNAIDRIKEKYAEVNWLFTGKSFSKNKSDQILIQIDRKKFDHESGQMKDKAYLLNSMAKSVGDHAQNYIVITEINRAKLSEINKKNNSNSQFYNVEFTKGRNFNGFNENINNKDYFKIEQDFFTCYFIKIDDKDYLEKVQEIIAFKNLDEFRKNMSLSEDEWDDYGYQRVLKLSIWKENFYLHVNPRTPEMIDYLKGVSKEKPGTDTHDNSYYCSLGDGAYYNFLNKYALDKCREDWFELVNDIAFKQDSEIDKIVQDFERYVDTKSVRFKFDQPNGKTHNFFNNSFLRDRDIIDIKENLGRKAKRGFNRELHKKIELFGNRIKLIQQERTLPYQIYALIGRNGSGKTETIKKIILESLEQKSFSKVLHFSLSPFDKAIEVTQSTERYEKIGLEISNGLITKEHVKAKVKANAVIEKENKDEIEEIIESKDSVENEYTLYIQSLLLDLPEANFDEEISKVKLWKKCLGEFSFDNWAEDFKEIYSITNDGESKKIQINAEVFKKINELSSGQKTIILYISKLIASINEGYLVIFDEPETFMHPPMIKAFIRNISDIIRQRNATCIVATHTPIILQEIPHDCVYSLNRTDTGNVVIKNVRYRTYGESIDLLYKNIYGMELARTGFYSFLEVKRLEKLKKIRKNRIENESDDTEKEGPEENLIAILDEDSQRLLGNEARLRLQYLQEELESEGEFLLKNQN